MPGTRPRWPPRRAARGSHIGTGPARRPGRSAPAGGRVRKAPGGCAGPGLLAPGTGRRSSRPSTRSSGVPVHHAHYTSPPLGVRSSSCYTCRTSPMGQEIAYCALCGCQLRSVDFEKGGAFRVDLQSYCKKCAPEAVKSLPPEKIQAILKQGIAPPSRPSKPVAEVEGPSPSSRAIRISPRKSGPQQSLIVATASVGLGAVVLLLFFVFSGRPSPEPEPARSLPARPPVEPAPVAIKPPEPRPIAGGS